MYGTHNPPHKHKWKRDERSKETMAYTPELQHAKVVLALRFGMSRQTMWCGDASSFMVSLERPCT